MKVIVVTCCGEMGSRALIIHHDSNTDFFSLGCIFLIISQDVKRGQQMDRYAGGLEHSALDLPICLIQPPPQRPLHPIAPEQVLRDHIQGSHLMQGGLTFLAPFTWIQYKKLHYSHQLISLQNPNKIQYGTKEILMCLKKLGNIGTC